MSFLIAMQAAGLVTSYIGGRNQKAMIDRGRELEQAQFESNLETLKLQSAQESLAEMRYVKQNIGSQIAIQAARGNRVTFPGINASYDALNRDERMRQINLLAKQTSLMGQDLLSSLNADAQKNKIDSQFTKQFINMGITEGQAPGSTPLSYFNPESKNNLFKSKNNLFNWGV